jgi:hypothetical protein
MGDLDRDNGQVDLLRERIDGAVGAQPAQMLTREEFRGRTVEGPSAIATAS